MPTNKQNFSFKVMVYNLFFNLVTTEKGVEDKSNKNMQLLSLKLALMSGQACDVVGSDGPAGRGAEARTDGRILLW